MGKDTIHNLQKTSKILIFLVFFNAIIGIVNNTQKPANNNSNLISLNN